ncbi:undecaprenyl-diphosphate phosphatase [Natranaerobius trueperi]|uniref:Undecaprenyl-diphosphatase n=1 Tax=Natranaerobius trueperi TaxID=759412 RepID=A0A226BY28_9FIRM|nr:undecaprenyl-diphosphate phosphatase [Natranaerobius trueperi]OWZ83831.1 UDP pyrophosphate phosphatase [Natranaerobius trueperi]
MVDLYTWLQYIFLGILQGATEPLPISSSGHLVIAQHLFGIKTPDLHLEVFLNGASLFAVFFIYKDDIIKLILDLLVYFRNPRENDSTPLKFSLLLVIATIPAVIIGGFLSDFIGGELTNVRTVAVSLLVTGIALWLIRKLRGTKQDSDISFVDALIIGGAQSLALAPGISRSGATVVAGLGKKLAPDVALKFSFFMSIPVSIGSLVFESGSILTALTTPGLLLPYLLAFVVAIVISILSIKLLINLVTNGNLIYFSGYCLILSLLLLMFR